MADSYAFLNGKNVYDSEQVTVSTTAIGGTAAKILNTADPLNTGTKATAALIQAVANSFYYTLDGTTPSGSNGGLVGAGEILALAGHGKISKFLAIRATASDAVVNIQYYS
jgi:hypothetical protein